MYSMSTACGRPQGGRWVWLMWTHVDRGSKIWVFVDVINGWHHINSKPNRTHCFYRVTDLISNFSEYLRRQVKILCCIDSNKEHIAWKNVRVLVFVGSGGRVSIEYGCIFYNNNAYI